jgi:hypothetical protein
LEKGVRVINLEKGVRGIYPPKIVININNKCIVNKCPTSK